MNKANDGYILLDTITALLILSMTLTSVYGLIIKSLDLSHRIKNRAEIVLKESLENENRVQELF